MQENKETGKRRGSPSARAVKCLKKATAGVLSAVMVFAGMPAITGITAMADEMPQATGSVIDLTGDIALSETYVVNGEEVVINLNGYTLSLAEDVEGSVIEIINNANVTINGDESKNSTITGGNGHKSGNYTQGGGIYVDQSTLTLNNVTVTENSTNTYEGGGIFASGSKVTIAGCVISKNSIEGKLNSSHSYGGALYANECELNITGTAFESNSPTQHGGAIQIEGGSGEISNCSFDENEANTYGGAVDVESANVKFEGCTFSENKAGTYGGAVDVGASSEISFNECGFVENHSGLYGGGAAVTGTSKAMFKNCNFEKNSTDETSMAMGGGLYLANYGAETATTISNCTFDRNSSGDAGGGIGIYPSGSSNSASYSITNSKITNNTALGGGGGMYIATYNSLEVTISGTEISGNSAVGNYGGGIYLAAGTLEFDDKSQNYVCNNTSDSGASDIAKASNSNLTLFDAAEMNREYEADSKEEIIDGWYNDKPGERYTPSVFGEAINYDLITGSAYLVASYTPDFSGIDEEIVPEEDDREHWEKAESIGEYTAIEFEMSTNLPRMSSTDLEALTANDEEFTMVFHNVLDDGLKVEPDEADLHITIGGATIDPSYYNININSSSDEWHIGTLSALSPDDDGCTFHVTVDLKALYSDEKISVDDFSGDTEIIVFFYADLENVEDGDYVSSVKYEIWTAEEEPLYESDWDEVTISLIESLKVTFYPGLFGKLEGETEFKVAYGESFNNAIPVVIPQDGYEFDCWIGSDGEEYYDEDDFLGLVITADMSFTAVYKMADRDVGYGTISVTKEVENMPEGKDISYNFALVMESMESESSSNASHIVVETGNNASHVETASNASRKVVEFQLKDGETATFYGIPEGWVYEVVETSQSSDYDTDASAEGAEATKLIDEDGYVYIAATMESGDEVTVTYVNTYEETNDNGGKDNPDTEKPEPAPEPIPEPDESAPFEFTKTSSRGETTVSVGTNLTYTITYKNDTDESATITIVDPLDAGLTYSSASDGGVYDSSDRTVTWTIENVKPGEEGSVTVTARVNYTGRTEGRVTNTAELTVEGLESGTYEASASTSNTVSRTTSSSSGGSGSSGSSSGSSSSGNVTNVNTGKTGHWILEGGYLTLPDGSHPSNEYLNVDGEVWAFYTYGYAVARRHTEYYTSAALAAVGYIPEVTGTWETIGWWFEYDDGTYPHDEWAQLEYNGKTYWYHFDVDGWMDDGWFIDKNGDTYYLDPVYDGWRGHMMTGWQLIGGYWYYFSEDPNSLGVMLKDTTTPDGFKVDADGRWVE